MTGWNVGSAFLGATESMVYLITAAHVPPGTHPPSDWSLWPDTLTLHLVDGTRDLDLFTRDRHRTPRFGYLRATDDLLADALWMPLGPMDQIGVDLLAQQKTYFLRDTVLAPPGSPLEVHGFPTIGGTWPPTVQIEHGSVLSVREGPMIEADITTVGGFSGGPALDAQGQLLGLHIGHDPEPTDPGQIVPAPTIRTMIAAVPM